MRAPHRIRQRLETAADLGDRGNLDLAARAARAAAEELERLAAEDLERRRLEAERDLEAALEEIER